VAGEKLLTEVEELKIIYKEIIDGCSPNSNSPNFIKHLTDLEHIEITRKRLEFYRKYVADGIPNETEKLQDLISSEAWSKDNEEKILEYRYSISDNEKNIPKLIPQQQPMIQRIVNDTKAKLNILLLERAELMGSTANEFAEKEGFNYYLFLSLYKDRECKDRLFKEFAELDELESEDLKPFFQSIEETKKKITESNIKKISSLPFFINTFSYSKDNVTTFLSKPISQLTPYQVHLFSLGVRNINILGRTEGEPPELHEDTKIDDVVLWYDQQYSVMLGKQKAAKR
jgi:hypothetical protein